jgi:hypothetical protein
MYNLYYYTFSVPVCTWYILVHTVTKPVHTKYPVPVMLFRIPDVGPRLCYCQPSLSWDLKLINSHPGRVGRWATKFRAGSRNKSFEEPWNLVNSSKSHLRPDTLKAILGSAQHLRHLLASTSESSLRLPKSESRQPNFSPPSTVYLLCTIPHPFYLLLVLSLAQ